MKEHENLPLQLKPQISYPREAQVGKTYLMSIDVQLANPQIPWEFPEEEYTIGFILNTQPYFSVKPLHGDRWPTVILHRYGGTYGPAEYLLTAADHEIAAGHMSITLVNGWGIPMTRLELPCEVILEVGTQKPREIEILSRKEVALSTREILQQEKQREQTILIESKLKQAGWAIQDETNIDTHAAQGIAIREFVLTVGRIDYLLVVDGEAVGIIEIKRRGSTLVGVSEQKVLYQKGIQKEQTSIRFTRSVLPFNYDTTGDEIIFTNELEPDARSREIFNFHQPQTLAWWLKQAPIGTPNDLNDLLRSCLRRMPSLPPAGLRHCQFEAITNLERSLAENRPRALIHMASGTGKTYMAVNEIYRLLSFSKARRILYIVDRLELGLQVRDQLHLYTTPDTGRKFTDLFHVQLLQDNKLDPIADVHITTIQRLNAILTNYYYEENDLETDNSQEKEILKELSYNPQLPIEFYDAIFIDECNRSIYGTWQPLITYFDAFLIGLTALPVARSFAFFHKNLVMEYPRERAVADGFVVDYAIYHIRTELTEQGSHIESGNVTALRDPSTRLIRYEEIQDDLVYESSHLDMEIVVIDQIRTILTTYRDKLPEIFPNRQVVPKTVIFAKDDSHAEDIVNMAREVFGRGNEFVEKITSSIARVRSEELVHQFRNNYNPRIAVTVNFLLGADIKPVECIILMRSVKSRTVYEQILGLGCRTISTAQLQATTPDAFSKTHFILIDTVGITYNLQSDSPPLERKPSISLEKLLLEIAQEHFDTDYLTSLASRLGRLAVRLKPDESATIQQLTGHNTTELSRKLLDATNIKKQVALAKQVTGLDTPDNRAIEEAALQLAQQACVSYKNQELCNILLEAEKRRQQVIDDLSLDQVISAEFDETQALQIVTRFHAFLNLHKDQIEAFKNAYNSRSSQQLVQNLNELVVFLQISGDGLSTDIVWRAYKILKPSQVQGNETRRLLADMMALVCYTLQNNMDAKTILEPFQDTVDRRFATWLERQQQAREAPFTEEQIRWLELIRDHIASDLWFETQYFDYTPFSSYGGRAAAHYLFRSELQSILQELNTILVFGTSEANVLL